MGDNLEFDFQKPKHLHFSDKIIYTSRKIQFMHNGKYIFPKQEETKPSGGNI